jgi:PKD repeat protein
MADVGARKSTKRAPAVRRGTSLILAIAVVISLLVVTAGQSAKADVFGQIGVAWGAPGSGNGEFFRPALFGVDSGDGSVYAGDVTPDLSHYRIQKLSSTGQFKASVEIPRFSDLPEHNKIVALHGIAVDASLHRLYLVEGCKVSVPAGACKAFGSTYGAKQIIVYSTAPSGASLVPPGGGPATLPLPEGEEALYNPQSLAVDPSTGDLVILAENAAGHAVVQRISSAGVPGARFVDSADSLKPGNGGELRATSIAVGPDGKTYTVTGGSPAGVKFPGKEFTRAWRLPTNLASLEAVPGFAEAAMDEEWENGLLKESSAPYTGGPQIAISPDGSTLYWKENVSLSRDDTPGEVLIRAYSLTGSGETEVVYGGGKVSCAIKTSSAGIATTGDELVVFDYGPEVEAPSYGTQVLTFGPGGGGCPSPTVRLTTFDPEEEEPVPGEEITAQKGAPVAFAASESELFGTVLKKLEWEFGDGVVESSTEGEPPVEEVTHRYLKVGTFKAKLKMTVQGSPVGNPTPAEVTVHVTSPGPTAAFAASTVTPAPGAGVTFDASSSLDPTGSCTPDAGCSPTHLLQSYHWNFGDGSSETTTKAAVVHAFANSGAASLGRTVTLVVVSSDGVESAPVNHPITVQAAAPPGDGGGGGQPGGGSPPPSGGGSPAGPGTPTGTGSGNGRGSPPKHNASPLAKCKRLKGKKKAKCIKKAHRSGKR